MLLVGRMEETMFSFYMTRRNIFIGIILCLAPFTCARQSFSKGNIIRGTTFDKLDISLRQEKGTCPSPGVPCPLDKLCCPNACCSQDYPNCGEGVWCLNDRSESICFGEGDEEGRPCRPCPGTNVGCFLGTFSRCSTDKPDARCLTEEGFMACGEDSRPGVWCDKEADKCCILPNLCCPDRDGCCTEEEGGVGSPEPILPLMRFSPGVTPDADGERPSSSPRASPPPLPTSPPSRSPRASPPPLPTSQPPPACFPAESTVELKDGTVKRMRDLRTGDHVRVSGEEFSEVFMWTHREYAGGKYRYVTLRTKGGFAVTATVGHVLYRCRSMKHNCVKEVAQVEEIAVGDGVWIVEEGKERVANVTEKEILAASKGLFNPQTLHGNIIVDGVLCSCYTQAIQPLTAHSMLSPLRAFYVMTKKLSWGNSL